MSWGTYYDPIGPENKWPMSKYECNGFSVDNGQAIKTVKINGKDYLIRIIFGTTEKNPATKTSIEKELSSYTEERCKEIVRVALDIGLGKENSAKTQTTKPEGRIVKSVRFNFSNADSPIAYKEYSGKEPKLVNLKNYVNKLSPLQDKSKKERFNRLYNWFYYNKYPSEVELNNRKLAKPKPPVPAFDPIKQSNSRHQNILAKPQVPFSRIFSQTANKRILNKKIDGFLKIIRFENSWKIITSGVTFSDLHSALGLYAKNGNLNTSILPSNKTISEILNLLHSSKSMPINQKTAFEEIYELIKAIDLKNNKTNQ